MNATAIRQDSKEVVTASRKTATLRPLYYRPGDVMDDHLEQADNNILEALSGVASKLEDASTLLRKVRSYCMDYEPSEITIEGDASIITIEGPDELIDTLVDKGLAFPFTREPDEETEEDTELPSRPRHKQILVTVGKREDKVDERLVPLINELWKADIDTFMSCQENGPGIAWIEFTTAGDLQCFLDIVGEYEKGVETLYNRIAQVRCHKDGTWPTGTWEYDMFVDDFNFDDDLECQCEDGPTSFMLLASVRFPVSDLPILVERMRDHNEKHESK